MNSFDWHIVSFLNRFAQRSVTFDEFVVLLSLNSLLKGGVIVGIIWWVWFESEDSRRKREALLAGADREYPGLGYCQDIVGGDVSCQTWVRSSIAVSASLRHAEGRLRATEFVSQRPRSLFFRTGDRNFHCLSTSRMASLRLFGRPCLPTPHLSRVTLSNRHSCRCCYWSFPGMAGQSAGNPKTAHKLGIAVDGVTAITVLLLFFSCDVPSRGIIRPFDKDRKLYNSSTGELKSAAKYRVCVALAKRNTKCASIRSQSSLCDPPKVR